MPLRYLTASFLLCAAAAVHAAPQCDNRLYTIEIERPEYGIDHSRDSKRLAQQALEAYSDDLMLGLTTVQSVIEVYTNELTPGPAGCVRPRIEIALRYAPMKLFIAREFLPNTCPYRVVMLHELRHVEAYRKHLPEVAALVDSALRARFAEGDLATASGASLQYEVDTRWIPFIRAELDKIKVPQRLIDTAAESESLNAACLGDIARILGRKL